MWLGALPLSQNWREVSRWTTTIQTIAQTEKQHPAQLFLITVYDQYFTDFLFIFTERPVSLLSSIEIPCCPQSLLVRFESTCCPQPRTRTTAGSKRKEQMNEKRSVEERVPFFSDCLAPHPLTRPRHVLAVRKTVDRYPSPTVSQNIFFKSKKISPAPISFTRVGYLPLLSQ